MRNTRLLLALAAAPLMMIACDNELTGSDAAVDVAVTGAGFAPPVLTLEPADSIAGGEGNGLPLTVAWAFSEGPHNVTFEVGESSSGLQADGSTFERDFTDAVAGTYRYRCTLHSTDFTTGEVGQIVVIN